MALDPLEIEAMLIRKDAVMATAKSAGMDGIQMLTAILAPTDAFLAASRRKAAETGPSTLARRLSRKKKLTAPAKPPAKPAKPTPAPISDTPTIDELLKTLG